MFHTEWTPELAAKLAEPFPPDAHRVMTDAPGQPITVSIHEYKKRLNNLVGPHGWGSGVRLQAIGGKMVAIVSVTVLGVTKENVGDEVEVPELNDRGNEKIIGSPATNSYSQAFKRTCSDFTLGEYTYDKQKLRDAMGAPVVGRTSPASNGNARPASGPAPKCPECNGAMWDNREGKRNPKAPDYKCKDKGCDGVIWPDQEESGPVDDAAELDRLMAGVRTMLRDLAGLNAERYDRASAAADDLERTENITRDMIVRLGAQVRAAIEEEKAAMVAAGPAHDDLAPDFPEGDLDSDLPF